MVTGPVDVFRTQATRDGASMIEAKVSKTGNPAQCPEGKRMGI